LTATTSLNFFETFLTAMIGCIAIDVGKTKINRGCNLGSFFR